MEHKTNYWRRSSASINSIQLNGSDHQRLPWASSSLDLFVEPPRQAPPSPQVKSCHSLQEDLYSNNLVKFPSCDIERNGFVTEEDKNKPRIRELFTNHDRPFYRHSPQKTRHPSYRFTLNGSIPESSTKTASVETSRRSSGAATIAPAPAVRGHRSRQKITSHFSQTLSVQLNYKRSTPSPRLSSLLRLNKSLPDLPKKSTPHRESYSSTVPTVEYSQTAPESYLEYQEEQQQQYSQVASSPLIHNNHNSPNLYMLESMSNFEMFNNMVSQSPESIIYDYDPRASMFDFNFDSELSKQLEPTKLPAPLKRKHRQRVSEPRSPGIAPEMQDAMQDHQSETTSQEVKSFSETRLLKKQERDKQRAFELQQYLNAASEPSFYTTKPLRVTSIISNNSRSNYTAYTTTTTSAKSQLEAVLNSHGLTRVLDEDPIDPTNLENISPSTSPAASELPVPPLAISRLSMTPSLSHRLSRFSDYELRPVRSRSVDVSQRNSQVIPESTVITAPPPAIPPRCASRRFMSTDRISLLNSPQMSYCESDVISIIPPLTRLNSTVTRTRSHRRSMSHESLRSRRSLKKSLKITTVSCSNLNPQQQLDVSSLDNIVQDFISNDLSLLDVGLNLDTSLISASTTTPMKSPLSTDFLSCNPGHASFYVESPSTQHPPVGLNIRESALNSPVSQCYNSSVTSSSIYSQAMSSALPSPVNDFNSPRTALGTPGLLFPVEKQPYEHKPMMAEKELPVCPVVGESIESPKIRKKVSMASKLRSFGRRLASSSHVGMPVLSDK